MTTPDTKNGITKDSTLQISVNPYFPNNYKQTLNYVGYWKWDSTNQQFIQVLNNQDISDENYNLRIQPLFYDADTGLPQKVSINSGNTKRLKMVNDNNDGAMEPAEYIENNTMVKFNSKTRSVTEYPYFEVEALPPNISTPITSNGYYKFDGNTLIPGTNQDYNLNVNVTPTPSKINIKYVSGGAFTTDANYSLSNMPYNSSSSNINVNIDSHYSLLMINPQGKIIGQPGINFVEISSIYPNTVSSYSVPAGNYYKLVYGYYIYLKDENKSVIFNLVSYQNNQLLKTIFSLDKFNFIF